MTRCVQLMTTLGFNVNVRRRVTALPEAAANGDLAMVKLLVELGGDPTIHDTEHHSSPPGWATHSHHQQVGDYLADRAS